MGKQKMGHNPEYLIDMINNGIFLTKEQYGRVWNCCIPPVIAMFFNRKQ